MATIAAVTAAFLITFKNVLWGPVRPQRASWLGWLVADLVTAYSTIKLGGVRDPTFGLVAAYSVGASITCILSIWKGKGGSTPFDWACLALGIAGAVASGYFGQSSVGVVAGTAALIVAGLPNIGSAWDKPKEEPIHLWWLFLLACALSLAQVTDWRVWQSWLFPAGDLTYVAVVLGCCHAPRRAKK